MLPSDIGGSLADGRRELVNLAKSRKNAHRQQEQSRSGDPAWERTKRLGAIYAGLLTFGPPALVVINQVLEALALVAAVRLGPRALAAKEILMDLGFGLVEQTAPRAAVAGAGLTGMGVADDFVRASKPMLAEADEAARLGGRGAEAVSEAAASAVSANRLHHIFDNAEHALDGFVTASGGQQSAFALIQDAANAALKQGKLTVGPGGVLPGGDLGNVIDVGGTQIRLIGGRVVEGTVMISSASRKGL